MMQHYDVIAKKKELNSTLHIHRKQSIFLSKNKNNVCNVTRYTTCTNCKHYKIEAILTTDTLT